MEESVEGSVEGSVVESVVGSVEERRAPTCRWALITPILPRWVPVCIRKFCRRLPAAKQWRGTVALALEVAFTSASVLAFAFVDCDLLTRVDMWNGFFPIKDHPLFIVALTPPPIPLLLSGGTEHAYHHHLRVVVNILANLPIESELPSFRLGSISRKITSCRGTDTPVLVSKYWAGLTSSSSSSSSCFSSSSLSAHFSRSAYWSSVGSGKCTFSKNCFNTDARTP